VIEKLYLNKRVRMSTADRLIELCVRNNIELSIPLQKKPPWPSRTKLIAEPSEEPTFDDVLFRETQEAAAQIGLSDDEDTHEVDEEGEEKANPRSCALSAHRPK